MLHKVLYLYNMFNKMCSKVVDSKRMNCTQVWEKQWKHVLILISPTWLMCQTSEYFLSMCASRTPLGPTPPNLLEKKLSITAKLSELTCADDAVYVAKFFFFSSPSSRYNLFRLYRAAPLKLLELLRLKDHLYKHWATLLSVSFCDWQEWNTSTICRTAELPDSTWRLWSWADINRHLGRACHMCIWNLWLCFPASCLVHAGKGSSSSWARDRERGVFDR